MRIFIRKWQRSERGATAVEYGLIIAMIVLAIVSALSTLGTKTNAKWNVIAAEFNNH